MTPSLTRNPAASAKSSPGVRIVMASGLPFSRISRGSSATRVSGRVETAPSRMRMVRRRSVTRPMAVEPDSVRDGSRDGLEAEPDLFLLFLLSCTWSVTSQPVPQHAQRAAVTARPCRSTEYCLQYPFREIEAVVNSPTVGRYSCGNTCTCTER